MKTWFKGLIVFVFSTVVTSIAANQLDPAAFSFSRSGFVKLASLAAVIGAKAVYLYLKQSPLPGSAPIDWGRISGAVLLIALLPVLVSTTGCYSSWEQTTYSTLATSKAVIDCAVAGYNRFDADIRHACTAQPEDPAFDPKTFYLPQTREAQQAIEKARQVQVACVEAFAGYAVAKVAKDKQADVAEKQAAVVSYLAQLPALLDAVRALMGKPPQWQSYLEPRDFRDPSVAMRSLQPKYETSNFVEVR
ncbi:MAG TPA: hypothetical protein VE783_00060 [Candidatus Limnocylindrales bacterium]|nr:hypothetical protein [Candidatus Limnocylindrales bacterium]